MTDRGHQLVALHRQRVAGVRWALRFLGIPVRRVARGIGHRPGNPGGRFRGDRRIRGPVALPALGRPQLGEQCVDLLDRRGGHPGARGRLPLGLPARAVPTAGVGGRDGRRHVGQRLVRRRLLGQQGRRHLLRALLVGSPGGLAPGHLGGQAGLVLGVEELLGDGVDRALRTSVMVSASRSRPARSCSIWAWSTLRRRDRSASTRARSCWASSTMTRPSARARSVSSSASARTLSRAAATWCSVRSCNDAAAASASAVRSASRASARVPGPARSPRPPRSAAARTRLGPRRHPVVPPRPGRWPPGRRTASWAVWSTRAVSLPTADVSIASSMTGLAARSSAAASASRSSCSCSTWARRPAASDSR